MVTDITNSMQRECSTRGRPLSPRRAVGRQRPSALKSISETLSQNFFCRAPWRRSVIHSRSNCSASATREGRILDMTRLRASTILFCWSFPKGGSCETIRFSHMYASTWSCGTPLPSAYMQHHESSVYGSNYCGFPSIFSAFERVYASPLRPASHAVEDKHSLPLRLAIHRTGDRTLACSIRAATEKAEPKDVRSIAEPDPNAS
jgi:hypothetical protein